MESDLVFSYFIRVICSFFLEIGLKILINDHHFFIFFLESHNFVNSFLKLVNMADIVLLFCLVLLQDTISRSQISFVFIDCLLEQPYFISNIRNNAVLFAHSLLQSLIFLF